MSNSAQVHIIGAGLAGSEAAHFLANSGVNVTIHEMRPQRMTEAHKTSGFAELVCSNSLKSDNPGSAPGILKSQMKTVGSLVLDSALKHAVPAGEALAVERDGFSSWITEKLRNHPRITVSNEEVSAPIPNAINLIATGPLTSGSLASWIQSQSGMKDLYFYDAIAPIIDASTIDQNKVYSANRYDHGDEVAYVNCPFDQDEYDRFIGELLTAEKVAPKNFEAEKFFQGCQPIEAIAERGHESLRFGPMKPIGLRDPRTGKTPHAVVQLRPENVSRSAFNMVGFQTKLKYPEQLRIFRKIPGLEKAEFLRLGSIHRNTYICAPSLLRNDLSLKGHPKVYFAGQITGVEGYLESAACGMLAAIFILQRLKNLPHLPPPPTTAMGALLRFLVQSDPKNFSPTNIHFGLFDHQFFSAISEKQNKDLTRQMIGIQSNIHFMKWWESLGFKATRANDSERKLPPSPYETSTQLGS